MLIHYDAITYITFEVLIFIARDTVSINHSRSIKNQFYLYFCPPRRKLLYLCNPTANITF